MLKNKQVCYLEVETDDDGNIIVTIFNIFPKKHYKGIRAQSIQKWKLRKNGIAYNVFKSKVENLIVR